MHQQACGTDHNVLPARLIETLKHYSITIFVVHPLKQPHKINHNLILLSRLFQWFNCRAMFQASPTLSIILSLRCICGFITNGEMIVELPCMFSYLKRHWYSSWCVCPRAMPAYGFLGSCFNCPINIFSWPQWLLPLCGRGWVITIS